MDLNKYSVIQDYKLFAVFQPESVYDSTIENNYIDYTYDKGYPVINLKPEFANNLSGKITLPGKDPDGNYIKGIGLITAYLPEDAEGTNFAVHYEQIGINITHIFFEKDNEYTYVESGAFGNPKASNQNYKLEYINLNQ